MASPEIEARTNKLISVLMVVILPAALIYVMLGHVEEILDWRNFISFKNIPSLFLFCGCILGLLLAFDRQPKLKISREGLWVRKSDFPFRKLYMIPWPAIHGFYILNRTQKRITTKRLVIVFKDGDKDKSTEINFLDKSVDNIISVMG